MNIAYIWQSNTTHTQVCIIQWLKLEGGCIGVKSMCVPGNIYIF